MYGLLQSLFIIQCAIQVDCDKVEYYEKLWQDNIQKAKVWTRPTRNNRFESAYQARMCYDYGKYDYVIVGGGSAGAVVANRLSILANHNVLLLEAGDDENDFTLIPDAVYINQVSDRSWGYLTTPQENMCFDRINNQCALITGLSLGGSSAINSMIFTRGNKNDFNSWVEDGIMGWSYEEVLPYFKRAEDARQVSTDATYRGLNGPIKLTYNFPEPNYLDTILDALIEYNLTFTDYNGDNQIGMDLVQKSIFNGRRVSTNQAYLKPIIYRSNNLNILTNALATKILINNKRANAVEFLYDDKCYYVHARKEVILSAGAINTPQLLMLSGIGPREDLSILNIDTVIDLPVGKDLMDHVGAIGFIIATNTTLNETSLKQKIDEYLHGEGELANEPSIAIAFLPSTFNNTVVDIELLFVQIKNYLVSNPEIMTRIGNFNNASFDNRINHSKFNFMAGAGLLNISSKGYITLASTNPLDYPLINPNFLKNETDRRKLVDGLKQLEQIVNSRAFQSANVSITKLESPECDHLNGDDYWYCVIRQHGSALLHPIGTCKMGTDSAHSVVNNQLKVHGIANLRIVDASVIPKSVSGHTNAVVIMIAEKISQEILNQYL